LESTKRLLANIELFKREKEQDEILRWRHATAEDRWRAIGELMDWAEDMVRMRGRPHIPDELPVDWLPRRS
jgi:hypothetical protein